MHNAPQPDRSTETAPADVVSPAPQPPKDAVSPNRDARPVATGETVVPEDQGGFVKLDEHGMVLHFVPLQEQRNRQLSDAA